MKVNIDKLVGILAGLAATVLPVLVKDHVLRGALADSLGAGVGAFVLAYHIQPGLRLVLPKQAQDVVTAVADVTTPAPVTDPSATLAADPADTASAS